MRRAEEILEIAEILDQPADRLARVLERSSADKLHPAETLREMARYEIELALLDIRHGDPRRLEMRNTDAMATVRRADFASPDDEESRRATQVTAP